MSFQIGYFAAQCLEDFNSRQRQKTNECYKIINKNFELSKWPILVNKMSNQFQTLFSSPMSGLLTLTVLRAPNVYM